jgi:hypothetical protein
MAGSMSLVFMRFDLRFQAEANRTKRETQFHRADSDDTVGFVALAEEQLALVAENGLHDVPFNFVRRIFSVWGASAEADDVSFADM